ncbi:MAG: glutaredoxin [Candidatus Magasanikbacteria bacterium CG_4_9_14_0_2_um_filter_42_11]|uniref:Glutaredoxin n=1 Tax=Candidatus Magasanikbacteria bacterium CG_4_9_14_0_2_um_filter_42_11 TaxID=1974643 RepID=A0A2M8F9B8_9BACT|nr:MAG: glutaredoxin [Candidatus Magasanikbacteria bacterium CG10_big_fil_rev_8_21_14_0_10_43_9]PIY92063.1 MAG: glutaredoxin [Candidatus Magasanikbacteria bacterium CG_4_10_14_0_8_um_filter_42_12]PJC52330.1 MAG: glutaredoxin [Candidatus Magasanikbacteria bacterium CG_4_9_14_0_2_um_filter_42_11]
MANITLYTTPVCGFCRQAKQLLDSLGIPYTEVDVIANPEIRDEMVEKTGHRTVPIIMNGDELIGGYDALKKLHDEGKLKDL